MSVADIIVIMVLAVLVCLAFLFICREKKRGRHCVGCPMSGNCDVNKKRECGNTEQK